jgi:HAD superfamily hydrolase (TIGR01549 family)
MGHMVKISAVFFDLFKTLGDFKEKLSDETICRILQKRGYEVYPQTFQHAFAFVTFIDNPRIGFRNYPEMFHRAFERIGVEVDDATIREVSKIYEDNPFKLYPESTDAVKTIKNLGLKTAIVTTPPRFWFETGIKPILGDIDYICTSTEAGCEKSNPRIFDTPLKMLGIKPQEVVVIGDDPILDITNPHNLGMKTIQITDREASLPADATARNVLESNKIIEKWYHNPKY